MISPILRRDMTTRLFRQLHQNDDPDWYRASGSSFCGICGLQYRDHPEDDEHPNYDYSTDKRLCNGDIRSRIERWTSIKNDLYNGQAGLQFSINSTNEVQRDDMFSGDSLSLRELSEIVSVLPDPVSRKYCLNFAFSTDFEINAVLLRALFDPEKFMIKITPIHNNTACRENKIETVDGYSSFAPYAKAEQELIDVGFDVLVFVPSMDEEDGLVTCGNAVLGGSELRLENNDMKIIGIKKE